MSDIMQHPDAQALHQMGYDEGYRAGLERAAEIRDTLLKGPVMMGDPHCDGWDGGITAYRQAIKAEIAKHAADELTALSQEMKLDY